MSGTLIQKVDMENTTHMRLVRAVSSDASAVRQLVRDSYAKWVPVFGREPMPMTADYDAAVRDHEIELLYIEDSLVAIIELIIRHDDLFIENIAVAPSQQKRGLGRHLIAHAVSRAKTLRLPRLCLLTGQLMESNVRLYQSLGFQIDRTEPFMDGFTVYMSKDLAAA